MLNLLDLVIPHIEVLEPNEVENARRDFGEAIIVKIQSDQSCERAQLMRKRAQ